MKTNARERPPVSVMRVLCSSSSFARRDTKTIHRERERVSRVKEATTYHFVFDYEKCGFYSDGRKERNKERRSQAWPGLDKPYTLNSFRRRIKNWIVAQAYATFWVHTHAEVSYRKLPTEPLSLLLSRKTLRFLSLFFFGRRSEKKALVWKENSSLLLE